MRTPDEYPEPLRRYLFRSDRGPSDIRGRDTARVGEVSPCSEYTRVTMEGTLKDSCSDLSSEFEPASMGAIFMNGPFKDAKWSEALGYGMAVIEGDTRLHINKNGKFVIRRALDQAHAATCYKLVCDLFRPSLICSFAGSAFFELLAENEAMGRNGPSSELRPFFGWPEGSDGSEANLIKALASFRSMRSELLPGIASIISKSILEAIMGECTTTKVPIEAKRMLLDGIERAARTMKEDPWTYAGRASYCLYMLDSMSSLEYSLEHLMDQPVLTSRLKEEVQKGGLFNDIDPKVFAIPTMGEGMAVRTISGLARVHYLLGC